MSAYPEKLDLECIFRGVAPGADREAAARSGAKGHWRVVGEDGSTSTFDPACQTECSSEGRRAEKRGGSVPAGRKQAAANVTPVRPKKDAAMPTAVADLAEMLAADQQGKPPCPAHAARASMSRSNGQVGRSRRGRSESLVPPSTSSGCRDIDSHLARIIDIWPELPRNLQSAILAIIETARHDEGA